MMLMRSSPPTTEQMLVALCPLKPTNPKPRGPPRRAALWLRKNPQLRSSFIADDNEQYRPKIAGGDFLPGVHIRVGGFADVSQSIGKRKITIYPVFRVLYLNQGDSGRRFGPIDGRLASISGSVILPRKWRRSDLRPGAVSIELYCDHPVSLDELGRSKIDEALQSAVATISGDPLLWRHLADPKERSRTLGDASVLRDQESYSRALAVPLNR